MKQYLDGLREILDYGHESTDRTGTGTLALFGLTRRYNLSQGFPLVTTKKLHTKSIFHELLWFIKGDTNIGYLKERGVRIWDEWADNMGDLGPIYGHQWRSFGIPAGQEVPPEADQITTLIKAIKATPDSRRLIVSAWNPLDIGKMALPPCHTMFQVRILAGKLHLQLYQRSGDMFLGVPFNIASYALLQHMLAEVTGYEVGDFVHTIGDAHIYSNHMDKVKLQLSREPKELPKLRFARKVDDFFDFRFEDIIIDGYDPYPHIKGEVAV